MWFQMVFYDFSREYLLATTKYSTANKMYHLVVIPVTTLVKNN